MSQGAHLSKKAPVCFYNRGSLAASTLVPTPVDLQYCLTAHGKTMGQTLFSEDDHFHRGGPSFFRELETVKYLYWGCPQTL